MREAAVAFCAFALLIAAPIAILSWFGSLSDQEKKQESRRREMQIQKSEARLWNQTLLDLQASATPAQLVTTPAFIDSDQSQSVRAPLPTPANVAFAPAQRHHTTDRFKRAVLARCVAVASAIGLAACETIPPPMAIVQPGMGTAELVAIAGGPDYIRSNGTVEVWQYCRDFGARLPWRDEGRSAKYYTAVLVDRDQVREVRPYPIYSDAGCQDFYRAEF